MALAREYEVSIKERQQKLTQDRLNQAMTDQQHIDIGAKLGLNDSINEIERKKMQKYYLGKTNGKFSFKIIHFSSRWSKTRI